MYQTYDSTAEPERDIKDLNNFIDKYGVKYLYARSAREQPDMTDMDTIRRNAEVLAAKRLAKKFISIKPNYSKPTLTSKEHTRRCSI